MMKIPLKVYTGLKKNTIKTLLSDYRSKCVVELYVTNSLSKTDGFLLHDNDMANVLLS